MPTHTEKRKMPYSAQQMYDLVADIGSYPQFLPWCAAARERGRSAVDGAEVIEADLVIAFKAFREKFGSRVTLHADTARIDVEYLDGPFKYLINHWKFTELPGGGCEADFFVDFEFKSILLQKIIGLVFTQAMQRIVAAFEKRADDLYGNNL